MRLPFPPFPIVGPVTRGGRSRSVPFLPLSQGLGLMGYVYFKVTVLVRKEYLLLAPLVPPASRGGAATAPSSSERPAVPPEP